MADQAHPRTLPKILVVDDKPENLFAMKTILSKLEVEIVQASSGDEALRQIIRHRFVVVLMDVKMPDMNGIETATLMQGHDNATPTPVIFVTGYGADELDQLEGYAAGAADYIIKPVNPEIVKSKVGIFLQLYLQSEEIEANNAALAKANSKLAHSNEDLEQFAYAISHDLKEPIRMVSGFMTLLEKRYQSELDERAREYIHRAIDGADRMGGMITALLEFAKLGRDDEAVEYIEIRAVVDAACVHLRMVIEESNAEITSDDLPMVNGKRALLVQLFQNLISNAIKYNGRLKPVIKIDAEKTEKNWVFSVSDNGIGMEEKNIDKIFGLFQRLHPVDQYPGSGMGLSTCKRIVESCGGNIWVKSIPGDGSTFYFTLPDTAHDNISNVA